MKINKEHAIKPKRLSEKDQELINRYFTYLDSEDKDKITNKFGISLSYLNMIIRGTRYNKAIHSFALGLAIKKKEKQSKVLQVLDN